MTKVKAPELKVSKWLGTDDNISLDSLKGQVVLIEAFQLLCPGCVTHAIPQAIKARKIFADHELKVLGLHTVFEHHEAMQEATLSAFMHEYRINFPVGIDVASANTPIPQTMSLYDMRGTPTTLIIDKEGYLRHHLFGAVDDMQLAMHIQSLISE
ncbi:redoxin domain-containing protein [Aestuariibacter sp. AA17]|uniref:Redoxin domain-containing protein n=1 Tax=Fluctibacter corallii TaxID=2984329 RepID=A0ABT3A7E5_9ALTE|nr:redoxin domain-containing protein [Aestuariibacter sp. AA17]MCV2884607.1 redoxin domain-containing protein [Aestuariibacter sp. AA17]